MRLSICHTHYENYVRYLKTHPPPKYVFSTMAMCKGGFISNLRIRQFFFFIFCKNGWQEKLLLRFSDLYQLVISGNPFFSDSFDYVSILLTPPTHHVSKRKHLTSPTHPLFCLRNIWMVPKHASKWKKNLTIFFSLGCQYRVGNQ